MLLVTAGASELDGAAGRKSSSPQDENASSRGAMLIFVKQGLDSLLTMELCLTIVLNKYRFKIACGRATRVALIQCSNAEILSLVNLFPEFAFQLGLYYRILLL